MMTLVYILLILLAVAGGIWWYVFFSRPNPALPQATVTVQAAAATTSSSDASSGAALSLTVPAPTSAAAASGTDENPTLPEESLSIDGAKFTVEIASTMLQQARGLSNRSSLGANDGMLFIFSSGGTQSFWMKDMNFPLDMIWISGNTVVGFAQDAPAEPNVLFPSQIFSSPSNTDKVLEVNAGTVAKYNIKVGDTVTIGPVQ